MRTILALAATTLAATGATAIAQGRLCVLAVDDRGAPVPLVSVVVTPTDARNAASLPPAVSFAERERARQWLAGGSRYDQRTCMAPPLRLVTYRNGRACIDVIGAVRVTAEGIDASATIADGQTAEVRLVVAADRARRDEGEPRMQCGELRTELFERPAIVSAPPAPMDLPASVRTIVTDRELRSLPMR